MKKILYILFTIIVLFNFDIVSASTTTYARTKDDLGVNKKWEITSKNENDVLATPKVKASEKIYDFADILTDSNEYSLYTEASKFKESSGMDMVILTTNLDYSNSELEDYAANFYDYNDFGIDDDLYSGILLIINVNENNRYYNIYTFGNAQLYYPYERCETILDYMYNDITNTDNSDSTVNYYNAIVTFTDYARMFYNQGIPKTYNNYYVDNMGVLRKKLIIHWGICLIISLVMTSLIIFIFISKNKMIKKAGPAKEYLDNESVDYHVRNNQFISTNTTSVIIRTSNNGGFGGGSHMGSSGGGHGGGGGRNF